MSVLVLSRPQVCALAAIRKCSPAFRMSNVDDLAGDLLVEATDGRSWRISFNGKTERLTGSRPVGQRPTWDPGPISEIPMPASEAA